MIERDRSGAQQEPVPVVFRDTAVPVMSVEPMREPTGRPPRVFDRCSVGRLLIEPRREG
jgi:hypothetical protein